MPISMRGPGFWGGGGVNNRSSRKSRDWRGAGGGFVLDVSNYGRGTFDNVAGASFTTSR